MLNMNYMTCKPFKCNSPTLVDGLSFLGCHLCARQPVWLLHLPVKQGNSTVCFVYWVLNSVVVTHKEVCIVLCCPCLRCDSLQPRLASVLQGEALTSTCLCFAGEALQCYTCMGSTDEDCNRQGSKSCPDYSDACAVVRGHGSEIWFYYSYFVCVCVCVCAFLNHSDQSLK